MKPTSTLSLTYSTPYHSDLSMSVPLSRLSILSKQKLIIFAKTKCDLHMIRDIIKVKVHIASY